MKVFCKYIGLVALLWCSSCGDFLEEYSQDQTYAQTAADLDEILVGEGYMPVPGTSAIPTLAGEYYFPWLHLMDDDAMEQVQNVNSTRSSLSAFYTWSAYPYTDDKSEVVKDNTWERLYKHISVVNVVLKKSEDIHDFPEEVERIQGECYFLRAVNYYFLVNFYGKPYSKSSASVDLGVPVKTTEFIEDKYFSRNTVAEVYAQILSDLEKAKDLLKGKKRKTVYRADYYAVQAFLSRVYLYMEEYEKVIAVADSVPGGGFRLLDFNALSFGKDEWNNELPVSTTYKKSPETIFTQGGNAMPELMKFDMYQVSGSLLDLLKQDPNDLRKKFCTRSEKNYSTGDECFFPCKLTSDDNGRSGRTDKVVSSYGLIRLPEVILNKAEALAYLGREGEARELLDELRKKRVDVKYFAGVSVSGEELIDFIRDERRRELCFEGHRWFDLRRYAVNSRYPFRTEVHHDKYEVSASSDWKAAYQGTYRLKRYSESPASYVLPIPQHVIEFNRGEMKDNDPRPEIEVFNKGV